LKKLRCVCGKTLQVPDQLEGQKIRCKHCGKVLTVSQVQDADPAYSDNANPLAVKGHRRCAGCGKSYPEKDRICVACGIDLDTGAAIYQSLETQAPVAPPEGGASSGSKNAAARPAKKGGFMGFFARLFGRKG
jgi:ribosomal protein L37E